MHKGRLEAFSDGVIAIIITIMVLELKVPEGHELASLEQVLPHLCAYVLSFVYVGILHWNNHHRSSVRDRCASAAVCRGRTCNLLFWLSLLPFATEWLGVTHSAPQPTALYGVCCCWPRSPITSCRSRSRAVTLKTPLRAVLGRDLKGKLSPVLYANAIPLAFVRPLLAEAIYVGDALLWLVPDSRIESKFEHR